MVEWLRNGYAPPAFQSTKGLISAVHLTFILEDTEGVPRKIFSLGLTLTILRGSDRGGDKVGWLVLMGKITQHTGCFILFISFT